jgi:hypothetical protein
MMPSAWVALRPYNEAPRIVGQDVRGTANFINDDATGYSLSAHRAQHIAILARVPMERAALIATLLFGETAHG